LRSRSKIHLFIKEVDVLDGSSRPNEMVRLLYQLKT
jgi:hypothetical protein